LSSDFGGYRAALTFEKHVLELAREALKTSLSDDERGFIELVEKTIHD